MTGICRHIFLISLFALTLIFNNVKAQTVELTPQQQALLQSAEDSLIAENYQYSRQVFSQLLSLHNDEIYFRYQYAVCLVMLNSELDQAIDYLETSIESGKYPQAYYYLGVAHHYRYMFDKAIRNYTKFLGSNLSDKEKSSYPVHRQIGMAENGKRLVEYAYMLQIMKNKRLTMSDFFYSYNLESIGGKFIRKHADFQTRYDRKKEDDPIMFVSDANNCILFSSFGKRGNTGKDIYRVDKTTSGSWGDPVKLDGVINTVEDEDFPYIHPSGKLLFFCSKGHNSMGGYDIFMSEWNEKNDNWGIPVNMDFPINSPHDDMLYVNDSANDMAIFASRRDSENDRVNIYTIQVNKSPEKRKIENMQDLINTSHLDVNMLAGNVDYRDDETSENDALDYSENQNNQNENTETETEQHDSESVKDKFQVLKNDTKASIEKLDSLKNTIDSKRNQYKHLVNYAIEKQDNNMALSALAMADEYEKKSEAITSDFNNFTELYDQLETQEENNQITEEISALKQNADNVFATQSKTSPLDALQNKIEERAAQIEVLEEEIETLKQQLEENQVAHQLDDFTNENIQENKQAIEKQNQQIAALTEKLHDYSVLNDKQTQARTIITSLSEAQTVIETLETSDTEIPTSRLRDMEQKQTQDRLAQFNENQNRIRKETETQYSIPAWYEEKTYQDQLENTINDERIVADEVLAENPEIKEKIEQIETLKSDILKEKAKLDEANKQEQIETWESINEKMSEIESVKASLSEILSTENLADNTTESNTTDTEENSNVQIEIEYPDAFTSEKEKDDFLFATNQQLEKLEETETEIEQKVNNLEAAREEQNKKLQNSLASSIDRKQAQNEQFKLVENVIELNSDVIEKERKTHNVLKNELYRYTDDNTGFTVNLREQIKEAVKLADEAESLEISAINTENPMRKMAFLEKSKEKIQASNTLLNDVIVSVTGESVYQVNTHDTPNSNTLKEIVLESTDALTESSKNHPFISPQNDHLAESIQHKDSVEREAIFEETEKRFAEREAVLIQLNESIENGQTSQLREEEDAMRFSMAEDVLSIYREAEPAILARIEENNQDLLYLQSLGLVKKKNIPAMDDVPTTTTRSSDIENMSPIQVHQAVTIQSQKLEKQIEFLKQQEDLINSFRAEKRQSPPGEWYDLSNKMNRLALPEIPVDHDFTSQQLSNFENIDLALPPSERRKKEKLEAKISKSDAKITEIEAEILSIRNEVNADEKSINTLEKLEDQLYEEKANRNTYSVDKQFWYMNFRVKDSSSTYAETVNEISDSLTHIAQNRYEKLKTSKENPKAINKELNYIKGLLSEANHLNQSLSDFNAGVMKETDLQAHISIYQEKQADDDHENLLADNRLDLNEETSEDLMNTENNQTSNDGSDENLELDTDENENFIDYSEIETNDAQNEENDQENLSNDKNTTNQDGEDTENMPNNENITESNRIEIEDNTEVLANDDNLTLSTENSSEEADSEENQNGSEDENDPMENRDINESTEEDLAAQDNQENETDRQVDENSLNKEDTENTNENVAGKDELFYRIQMVAYSRPLNDTTFRNISPVVDEQVPGSEIYRYLAGKFYNSNSWREALPQVKNQGFYDAFPVAYLNRERISLAKARTMRYLERNLPAEFRISSTTNEQIIAENTRTNNQNNQTENNNTSLVSALENDQSTFYTIQLGAFGRELRQTNIRGVSTDFYHRTGNGYFRYYHGKYTNYATALAEKRVVSQSIPDAFIVAFSGGNKVTREQANAILNNTELAETNTVPTENANEISFRIQIGAFSNGIAENRLQEYRLAFEPYRIGSVNRGNVTIYFIEGFESYEKAGQALKIMVKPVIGDAFVTAWRGEQKISLREALNN